MAVPGFEGLSFPPAPVNPWSAIDPATAKLLHPSGWVLTSAEPEALISGLEASPYILKLGYLYRWKVVPG